MLPLLTSLPTNLQEEAYDIREDHVRTELSQRFRTNFEQAGVGLDMKASGKPLMPLSRF
jgi:hypothetical protein